jgi:dodecin
MSVAKVSEITSSSSKSFEDAIKQGIKRFAKTVDKVQGAWVSEQKVTVKGGEIDEFRVTLKVTFVLKD